MMNELKCIGSKCPYYKEHEFRMSYFTCGLDGYSYKKDSYNNFFVKCGCGFGALLDKICLLIGYLLNFKI